MSVRSTYLKQQHYSRAVVLWTLGLFLGTQLLLGRLVEWYRPTFRDPAHFSRLEYLAAQQKETPGDVVLFLGSSRVLGIHAQAMSKQLSERLGKPITALRWANLGCGPIRHLLTWDRLERQGIRPSLVVLEVFLAQMNANRPMDDVGEVQLPTSELDAKDVNLILKYDKQRPWLREEQLLTGLFPIYAHRMNFLRQVFPKLIDPNIPVKTDNCADVRANVTPEHRVNVINKFKDIWGGAMQNFSLGGADCVALDDLIGRLTQSGIPTVLLIMPEGPAFQSWYPTGRYEEILAFTQSLAHKHGVRIINTRQWCNTEEAFADSFHLAEQGAIDYTRRLARDIIAPLIGHGESKAVVDRKSLR